MRMSGIVKSVGLIVMCVFLLPVTTFADEMDDRVQEMNTMITLQRSGDYQGCIAAADEILKENSSFMEAFSFKSLSYYFMGEYDKALQVLDGQLALNPYNEDALYNAACVASLAKQTEKAVSYLKTLKTLDVTRKSSIEKDKDFNHIKDTEEFQKLMGIDVRVGGELLEFDVAPMVIQDRTMLPMRTIFNALGASVEWNNDTNTVTAVKGDTIISLTIGQNIAVINSAECALEVAPVIDQDRTMVPVRFIADALGAEVEWDEANRLVDIMPSMPVSEGYDYEEVYQELSKNTAVIPVDGMWPEPYRLDKKEGIVFLVAKAQSDLDLVNSLSEQDKAKYLYNAALSNYGLVIGCNPIHVKFVVDGKLYYEGDMDYDQKDTLFGLTYYSNGLPCNVVKQFKKQFNYQDYYKLPATEQVTTTIDD